MSSTSGSWRVSLRIARRTLRKSWGRTLLIALLVATPIAAATLVDILARSLDSDDRQTARSIGEADALLVVTPMQHLEGYQPSRDSAYNYAYSSDLERDPAQVEVAPLLPPGTRIESPLDNGELTLAGLPRRNSAASLNIGALPREVTGFLDLEQGDYPNGDSVALTPSLAKRLKLLDGGDLVAGATIRERAGQGAWPVTGLVRDEWCLKCESVFTVPGSSAAKAATRYGEGSSEYYLDLPKGTDAFGLVDGLAAQGVALSPRRVFEHPDDYATFDEGSMSSNDWRAIGLTAVIVGFGILEIVLLAGAAFSVGARRQVRDLGLAAAAGASPRQVRTIVLAQGIVVGLLGAALGLLAGGAVAVGGWRLWERLDGAVIPSLHAGPELVFAVVFGAVAGLLAAVVPAIGASRMPVVAALAGRFRVASARVRRTPLVGAGLLALGVALAFAGERALSGAYQSYLAEVSRIQERGGYVSAPSPTLPIALILLGAITLMAGLLLVIPTLIDGLGSLAGRFPLPLRLAVRDAARHRQRTSPAAAAIVVSVAGAVLATFLMVGAQAADEAKYVPQLPDNTFGVSAAEDGNGDVTAKRAAAAEAANKAAESLPDSSLVVVRQVGRWLDEVTGTYSDAPTQSSYFELTSPDPVSLEGCEEGCAYSGRPIAIGDAATLALVLGRPATAEELGFLADGGALSTNPNEVSADGKLLVTNHEQEGQDTLQQVTLPGRFVEAPEPWESLPSAFVSAETAARSGWVTDSASTYVTYGEEATRPQVRAAIRNLEETGAWVQENWGPNQIGTLPLLVAGGVSAFVTLMAVGIAVALASAEGRADLSTLAAVGASPRLRRRFTAAQTLTLAVLGSAIGLVVGTLLAWALRGTVGAPSFEVPWASLAITMVGVPLFAVLVALVVTPSRLPLVRRLD